jgi:DNA polymerase-3 subunit beta
VSVPQGQLAEVLRQTVFAASKDETRPILTGALFSFADGNMQIVATDTYRLAMRKTVIAGGFEGTRTAIVSVRALNELLRVLSADKDDLVNVAVTDNQAEFEVGHVRIGSRLIEGQFPNFEKVIPDSHEKRVTLVAEDFEQALRRALIVAREDAYRVVLRAEGQALQISAESQDVGKVSEEMACRLDGEPAEIAFNCRYLLEVLEAIGTEEINLDLSGPLNPGMLRAQGVDDYLYVLMPMQIM